MKNLFRYDFILLISVLCAAGTPCWAQTREGLEAQRAETEKEIEDIENLLQETLKKKSSSMQAINLLDTKIKQRNKYISSIQNTIRQVDDEIKETEKQVDFTQKNLDGVKEKYASMVRQAYKSRNKYSDLMWILSAEHLNEAYYRTKYFKEIAGYRKNQIESIRTEQEELNKALTKLKQQKGEKEGLLKTEQVEQSKLNSEKAQQNKLAKQLNTKEATLKKQLAAQKKEADKLQKTIQNLIAAEAAKRKAETGSSSVTEAETKLSASFKENKGKLPWPCNKGVVTGRFGNYVHPVYKSITLQNSGIDITASPGTTVQAVFNGSVLYVALIPGSNMTVVIQHGNYITLYQNLIDVSVKNSDRVTTGQQIGTIYADSQTKTATLHFEIWDGDTKLNPTTWIRPK